MTYSDTQVLGQSLEYNLKASLLCRVPDPLVSVLCALYFARSTISLNFEKAAMQVRKHWCGNFCFPTERPATHLKFTMDDVVVKSTPITDGNTSTVECSEDVVLTVLGCAASSGKQQLCFAQELGHPLSRQGAFLTHFSDTLSREMICVDVWSSLCLAKILDFRNLLQWTMHYNNLKIMFEFTT